MPSLTVYLSDRAMASLQAVSRETGREVAELAECAVEEAALRAEPAPRPKARRARKEVAPSGALARSLDILMGKEPT